MKENLIMKRIFPAILFLLASTIVLADTTYRQYGNSVYGSDGSTYRQYGNSVYGSDGTVCRTYGNSTYCN